MPVLREIRSGKEIGYKGRTFDYIWSACLDCGKERWVRFQKGKPANERCNSCACRARRTGRMGNMARNWKGGHYISNGYVFVWLAPDDFFYPMANNKSYVLEHRLVVAKALGRNLHLWEIVHHKNGVRDDNRIENLQLISDDRHTQITILEAQIKRLKTENQELKDIIRAHASLGSG